MKGGRGGNEDLGGVQSDCKTGRRRKEEKQHALTALVIDDYLNKPWQDIAPPPPKHEFSINCKYLGETPVKMLMEGLSYACDIKPNMREKTINMFVSMGDILYDTATANNLRQLSKLRCTALSIWHKMYHHQQISNPNWNCSIGCSSLQVTTCRNTWKNC